MLSARALRMAFLALVLVFQDDYRPFGRLGPDRIAIR